MSIDRYFTVVHDPHGRLAVGTRLTADQVWQLLEARHDGLDMVAENGKTFRLYQEHFYRVEADGRMRLWALPTP